MAPLQSARNSPHKLVARNKRVIARSPVESTEVVDDRQRCVFVRSRNADALGNGHILGQRRSVRCRPHRCQVDFGHTRGVVEVYELDQVAVLRAVLHTGVLVLVGVILDGFGETHGGKALGEEGLVVAAAEVAVGTIDQSDLHVEIVRCASSNFCDEAAEVASGRVVFAANDSDLSVFGGSGCVRVQDAGAEEANSVVVDWAEGLEVACSDNIVVPVSLDIVASLLEGLR